VVPEHKLIKPNPTFYFLAVTCNPGDEGAFELKGRPMLKYRAWKKGDKLDPETIQVVMVQKRIRKLEVGDWVDKGQLVALVNPEVAYNEMNIQVAELQGAQSESFAARKLREAAEERLTNYRKAPPGTFPRDEMLKAESEYHKSVYDERLKGSAISSAQAKLGKALTTLQMYDIRASVPGRVKHIYKNHEGEAVKPNESIMELQNPHQLRVESLLDVQEAMKLEEGMEATVEATRRESPRVLSGHLGAVTCVAVSKGPKPSIISGDDQRTLLVWDLATGEKLWLQQMPSVPRALACTPPGTRSNLLLVGDDAGTVRLLNLDDPKAEPRRMAGQHQGAVNCVAFSPDGETCATGGADRTIALWKASTGELLHLIPGHRHAVTSLQFAGPDRLVSAGRDDSLAVWSVAGGKPPVLVNRFQGRSEAVAQLGVSPDGKRVLVDQDQGRELRVLSVDRWELEGTLANPPGTPPFSTMALFSPDGKTILTNGPAPDRLQLWRAPGSHRRGSELRQFIWNSGAVTCAAFAPDEFASAVTGTQDHQVLVWTMPSKEEVDTQLKARLTLVEKALDTSSRQVRVWARLMETPDWLVPGDHATLVVSPPPSRLPVR
jgi:WD40 repeat protein